MEIWEIITLGLAAIALPSVVILIGHLLTRERDRLKNFNSAGDEFRKVFNKALVDVSSESYMLFSDEHSRIMAHHVAYLNFRHHLRGVCRKQYDKAWEQYCSHNKHLGQVIRFTRATRKDLEKDIIILLSFAEYRLFRGIGLYLNEFLWKLKFKVFGPDKETKELAERIAKLYDDKKPPNS